MNEMFNIFRSWIVARIPHFIMAAIVILTIGLVWFFKTNTAIELKVMVLFVFALTIFTLLIQMNRAQTGITQIKSEETVAMFQYDDNIIGEPMEGDLPGLDQPAYQRVLGRDRTAFLNLNGFNCMNPHETPRYVALDGVDDEAPRDSLPPEASRFRPN